MSRFELSLSDGDALSSHPRRANGKTASRDRTDGTNGALPSERRQQSSPQKSPQPQPSPNRPNSYEPRSSVFSDQASVAQSSLNLFGEDFTKKVKRKRRWWHGCLNLSITSWVFLVLAFIQVVIVTGLQIVITVKGEFRSGDEQLDDYIDCTAESLNINASKLEGTSIPSFGEDKEIYIYFFIALVVYNFALCLYALLLRNIVELFTFMAINVLAMIYACIQVFQFRGFGDKCDAITFVGYFALINVFVLFIFTIVFGVISFFIYVEFGWKLYREIRCDAEIRHYYRWYEVFMSGVKILILFTVIFNVGQCILLLQDNYELWPTIVFVLAALVAYPFVYILVRRETHIGAIILMLVGLVLTAYFIFKVVRFTQRSCPLCDDESEDADKTRDLIRNLTNGTASNEEIELLIRGEELEHLVMIGVINTVTAIAVMVVFVRVWTNYGKGLREKYFNTQKPVCKCFHRPADVTDGGAPQGLLLRLWTPKARKKKGSASGRDSRLEETFSPMNPEFNLAPSTILDRHVSDPGLQGVYKPRSSTLPAIPEHKSS